MPRIKIFTASNVQQYGFTDREIDALNAEWEMKASELGLEEHLPEYWRAAKRHMNEKLAGRVAVDGGAGGFGGAEGEPLELPALEVDLDDFDAGAAGEITAVELPDEELAVEFLPDDLAGLEPISLAEMDEEPATVAGLALEEEAAAEPMITGEEMTGEEKPVEGPAIAGEPATGVAEAAPEQAVAVEERAGEIAAGEKIAPVAEPESEPADTAALPETAVEEAVRAAVVGEAPAPFAEQKKESFFGKIIARLKRMF